MRITRPRCHPTHVGIAFLAVLGLSCGNLRGPDRTLRPGACATGGTGQDAAVRPAKPDGSATGDRDGGVAAAKRRAILVSVDGLGAYYVQQQLAAGKLPNFAALQQAGAATLNARTDYEYTVTLPNHTSMLTGLPVSPDDLLPKTAYHGWTINGDVSASTTLHNTGNPNRTYIPSVFDVAHDHGFSTCLYSGKSKFSVFANSYNAKNGAPDEVDEDNGCNKIDRVTIVETTSILMEMVEADLAGGVCDFAFVHIRDMDWTGHNYGWGSEDWLRVLDDVDGWVGRIAAFADPKKTPNPFFLVVTADHGGIDTGHSDASLPIDYTIPYYIVGPEIPANTDLYSLIAPRRADPGEARIRYSAPRQPVRNADAANTITWHLGLPPVPGSLMRDLLK